MVFKIIKNLALVNLVQAFTSYSLGSIPGDECDVIVTVLLGDAGDGMIMGGATNSPMFWNKYTGNNEDTASCFEDKIPFLFYQQDSSSNENGIAWSRFYGEPGNSPYS